MSADNFSANKRLSVNLRYSPYQMTLILTTFIATFLEACTGHPACIGDPAYIRDPTCIGSFTVTASLRIMQCNQYIVLFSQYVRNQHNILYAVIWRTEWLQSCIYVMSLCYFSDHPPSWEALCVCLWRTVNSGVNKTHAVGVFNWPIYLSHRCNAAPKSPWCLTAFASTHRTPPRDSCWLMPLTSLRSRLVSTVTRPSQNEMNCYRAETTANIKCHSDTLEHTVFKQNNLHINCLLFHRIALYDINITSLCLVWIVLSLTKYNMSMG